MYNYYQSQKKKEKITKQQQFKNEQQKHSKLKIKNDKQLLKRYVQRTTHGFEKMMQVNREIKQYKNYHHQFRDFDSTQNLGPPSFYFQYRNQKQRINDALKQNCDLDNVPFFGKQNPLRHKFRQNKSEGNFKYTSYDTVSRVIQTVKNMKMNELPTSWNINLKKYLKTKRETEHVQQNQNEVKKTILPILNIKHHPKSLQTLQNKLKVGPLKDPLSDSKSHSYKEEPQLLKKKKIMNLTTRFNTVHVESLCLPQTIQ